MKVCGLIVEWNPFHNGHRYLIQRAREKTKCDILVAVMSGNFVQRGEPAIVSKWHRACVGLKNGVDLVLELPFWYATQPADLFALGGVQALSRLGCEQIAFGVEVPNFDDYITLAQWIHSHPKEVTGVEKQYLSANLPYHIRQSNIIQTLIEQNSALSHLAIDFEANSNTLLAYAYAKANIKLNHPLTMVPILRRGATHRETTLKASYFSSATAIRRYIWQCNEGKSSSNLDKLGDYMPEEMLEGILTQKQFPNWQALYPYVRYLLMTQSESDLSQYYQVYEGIERRLIRVGKENSHFDAFLSTAINKNWSPLRIQRALLMIALHIKEQEMMATLAQPQSLFLLGGTRKGLSYLKQLKKTTSETFEIISRASQKEVETYPIWFRADQIYQQFLLKQTEDENFGRIPLMME